MICAAILASMLLGAGPVEAGYADYGRYLHVGYFTPGDREPAEGYRDRIDRIVTDIQSFYAAQMAANGYGEMTFPLQRDGEGKVIVHVAKGDKSFDYYDGSKGQEVRGLVKGRMAQVGIDADNETILIFSNLIKTEGDQLSGDCPYYGGGSHRSGTAWVTDHELLDTLNFPKTEPFIVDRGSKQSVGRYCTIQIGGVAHELGHALGLPHTRAKQAEEEAKGTALMGSGNYTYREELRGEGKGSFLTRSHAMILSTHPLFRRSDEGADTQPACELAELECSLADGMMGLKGVVTTDVPVYGMVAYNDLAGGSDYDATAWPTDMGANGRFEVRVGEFKTGPYELRLRFLHENGAWESFGYVYAVDEAGLPDYRAVALDYELKKALAALEAGDPAAVRDHAQSVVEAAEAVPEDERTDDQRNIAEKATFLVKHAEGIEATKPIAPDAVPEERKSVYLPELEWEAAEVGWQRPTRDRIPRGEAQRFLESGERFHERGLYAHAPARHAFRLGGEWETLTGSFGLQQPHSGSVVFVVKADGEELLRSEVIKDHLEHELELDVSDVNLLELIVEPTDDGKASDWGVWFSPELGR